MKKEISDIEAKLKYLEDNSLNNPLRQTILDIRSDLLDFTQTLEEDINQFTNTLKSQIQVNIPENSQLENERNRLQYRLTHVLNSFDEYEKQATKEIAELKAQKLRDDYRINHLLKTIEELEANSIKK